MSGEAISQELLDHIIVASLVFQRGQVDGRRKREPGEFAKSLADCEAVPDILSLFGD